MESIRRTDFGSRTSTTSIAAEDRCAFTFPNIHLEASDRRLLASTVESFISGDEQQILGAVSFLRDILLADFPPETFIQELSLSECLLQILKEAWQDSMLNYVAFQSLYMLADLLASNVGFLNSTEFCHLPSQKSQGYSSCLLEGSEWRKTSSLSSGISAHETSEYFLKNYFRLLSGLSRIITYKPGNTYAWLLLQRYSTLIGHYLKFYRSPNVTGLYLNLEEILLDISQSFLRNVESVDSPLVATIMSTLLSNFKPGENKLFTADVRRAIWGLASNTQLAHTSYTVIREHFIQKAVPFENDLKKALDTHENDASVGMFRAASWWKLDVINEQRAWRDRENNLGVTTIEVLPELLFSIQNAVDHPTVLEGIENLWVYLLSISSIQGDSADNNLKLDKAQWRETFFRFLSVEPTSSADVDLLCRVLDLLSFTLNALPNTELLEWVVPLVSERNSAILRLMFQESVECISNTGAYLTTLNWSMYTVCLKVFLNRRNTEELGEIFNVVAETFKVSYEDAFPSAAILYVVLKSLANLIPATLIRDKLKETPEVIVSLVDITSNAVKSLVERSDDGGSYRNIGGLKYASVILAHLTDILLNEDGVCVLWKSHVIPIIPLIWASEDVLTRTSALQICSNLTSKEHGVSALLSQLESPTLLWRFAYTRLTDASEASIVKQRAASILINLIKHWDQMKAFMGNELEIPLLQLLTEISSLLGSVCWHGCLSELLDININQPEPGESFNFVTPNLLSLVSSIILAVIVGSNEQQIQLLQENPFLLREICIGLLRVVGSFDVEKASEQSSGAAWWEQSLISLTNTTEALTYILELNTTLPLILVSSKLNLSTIISYFSFSSSSDLKLRSVQVRFALWKNIFVLLTVTMMGSGQNFEDLERLLWEHRSIVFGKLVIWLQVNIPLVYRHSAIEFLSTLLNMSYERQVESRSRNSTSYFCQEWNHRNETYGSVIARTLLTFLEHTTESEERSSTLQCLNHIFLLSPSALEFSVQNRVVTKLTSALRDFGVKAAELQCNKRNVKSLDELKWLLSVLTTLFDGGKPTRTEALENNFADAIHTLLKLVKSQPEPSLLHAVLECTINYTAEFPAGSHSLTLTTGIVGVASRKIATPNSFYVEILGMLQSDLDALDRNPALNLRTMDLLLSLINNTSCSVECRNVLAKGKLPNFVTKLHPTEIRKWSLRYPLVKTMYLKTILFLTVSPDMQLCLANVSDSIRSLVAISKIEVVPNRLCVIQILRNLSFHSGNRSKMHKGELLENLVWRLNTSDVLEELECTAVTLWAVTANYEKGKVAAKRALCHDALVSLIHRLEAKRRTLSAEDAAFPTMSDLIVLLEKVRNVQIANNNAGV